MPTFHLLWSRDWSSGGWKDGRSCDCSVIRTTFSHLSTVMVDDVVLDDGLMTFSPRTATRQAVCPGCGTASGRVHGGYRRRPADVAVSGHRGRDRPARWSVHMPGGAELLFQVLTSRKEKNSVAIASHESFSGWTKTFTDPRLRAAIVDRLTFDGNLIQTGTDSYRLAIAQARAAAQDGQAG